VYLASPDGSNHHPLVGSNDCGGGSGHNKKCSALENALREIGFNISVGHVGIALKEAATLLGHDLPKTFANIV
jgi:hypothetical protein